VGVTLRDLGQHRLKDLQHPEPIFQLLHPALSADFPPLRSLEAFSHNLPIQLTSFIGREKEMEQVRRLLDTTRLLTLTGAGGLAMSQGDNQAAYACYAESLAIRRALGDKGGIASALWGLAVVAYDQGDYAEAERLYRESLAAYRELDNRWAVAALLNNIASVAVNRGDYAAAQALLEESVALKREIGDTHGLANSLGTLGKVAQKQGDLAQARTLLGECLSLFEALGDKHFIAYALEGFAGLASVEEPERAARLLAAVEALRESIGASALSFGQEEQNEDKETVRAALSAEAFAAAWAEGRAMSLERAVAYARGQTG
jgi:tetratricopeptide (TPR) repeat protein